MLDATPENIRSATVAEEGRKALSALCEEEYGLSLQELMKDPYSENEMRLLKIGRLMGVMLKRPFSEHHRLDPTNREETLTGARRGWQLRPEFVGLNDFELLTEYPTESSTWQYDVLNRLRGEENYSSVPE